MCVCVCNQSKKTFSKELFKQLGSIKIKYGKSHRVPCEERHCISGAPAFENIVHILFGYILYSAEKDIYLNPYLKAEKYWDTWANLSSSIEKKHNARKTTMLISKTTY